MSGEEAFLQAILEAPEDDTPRLVFADWLEDHGSPQRAEFIRVQCRLAELDEDDLQRRGLRRREYELLAEHWGEWAGPLVGRVRRWQFRRGFIEQVKAYPEQFFKEARWLFGFAPVRELHLKRPTLDDVRALVASRQVRHLARLRLDHAKLGDAGVELLAGAPNLRGLTHLSLRFTQIKQAGLRALVTSPHLASLRSLDVTANDLKAVDFEAFVTSCRLPALDELQWSGRLGPGAIRELTSSPLAGQLKSLYLREARIGPEGLRLLAEAPALARLESLTLEMAEDVAAGMGALAGSPLLGRLTTLHLSAAGLTDDSARELAGAGGGALRHLSLRHSRIGPDGATALAGSPLCTSLTRLHLSGNPIADRGAKALASANWPALRSLELYGCQFAWRGAKSLLAAPWLGQLSHLGVTSCDIGRKAFGALRERLGERLHHTWADHGLSPTGLIRLVKAEPPRCLRGLGAKPDTDIIRRFPRDRLRRNEYPCVAFELTHPDPEQRATLLGYEDDRGLDIHFSPWAIRWEPSGEQREFFDAEQHGRSAEHDDNCTIVGTGKRTAWKCGKRGCRDHRFVVTFFYRLEYPPMNYHDRHLPFADQFWHIDLDAYCGGRDDMIEVASFECK